MKRLALIVTAATLAAVLSACGKSSNVSTASSSAAPAASSGAVVAAAGTTFRGKLQQEVSSKKNHDGDKFTIEGNGETINAHLENVHAAGLGKKPSMVIVFDNIVASDGTTGEPVDVKIENLGAFDSKSHHFRTLGMMIGGAMAGHIAAGRAHQKHGGLAGAAGGYVLSQEMKTDIDVRPGTTIVLKFNKDAVAVGQAEPSATP